MNGSDAIPPSMPERENDKAIRRLAEELGRLIGRHLAKIERQNSQRKGPSTSSENTKQTDSI